MVVDGGGRTADSAVGALYDGPGERAARRGRFVASGWYRIGLAVDSVLPLVSTGAADRCQLATGTASGQLLAAAGWRFTLLGWATATLPWPATRAGCAAVESVTAAEVKWRRRRVPRSLSTAAGWASLASRVGRDARPPAMGHPSASRTASRFREWTHCHRGPRLAARPSGGRSPSPGLLRGVAEVAQHHGPDPPPSPRPVRHQRDDKRHHRGPDGRGSLCRGPPAGRQGEDDAKPAPPRGRDGNQLHSRRCLRSSRVHAEGGHTGTASG